MALKMKIKFDQYCGDYNLLISLAAIMDPTNKMHFIQFAFNEIYSSIDVIRHINKVTDSLHCLFGEYLSSHKAKILETQSQSDMQLQSSNSRLEKGKSRGRALFDIMMRNVDTLLTEKSELVVYLEERCVHNNEIDPPFDALGWWRQHSLKFPSLSKMACDILSILIRVIEPHLASLGANTVEMLMCGGDWVRALYDLKKKRMWHMIKEFTLLNILYDGKRNYEELIHVPLNREYFGYFAFCKLVQGYDDISFLFYN